MNGRVFAVNRSPVLAWNIEPQLQVPYPDMPAAAAAAISPIVPAASDPYGRCWQNQVDAGTSFPYFGALYNNSLPPTAYRLQPGCMPNLGQFWPPTPPPDGCGRFDGSNLYFGPSVLRHAENISSNMRNSYPGLAHYSHLVETPKEQSQRLFKRETPISPTVSAPSISICSSGSKSDNNLNSCCVVDSKMKSQISIAHSLPKPELHTVSSGHEPYLCAPDIRSSSSIHPSTDKSCFSPSHSLKNNLNFHNTTQDSIHRTKSVPGNQENCNASPLKNVYFSHYESENINSVHSKNSEKHIERQYQFEHKNNTFVNGNKSKHLYQSSNSYNLANYSSKKHDYQSVQEFHNGTSSANLIRGDKDSVMLIKEHYKQKSVPYKVKPEKSTHSDCKFQKNISKNSVVIQGPEYKNSDVFNIPTSVLHPKMEPSDKYFLSSCSSTAPSCMASSYATSGPFVMGKDLSSDLRPSISYQNSIYQNSCSLGKAWHYNELPSVNLDNYFQSPEAAKPPCQNPPRVNSALHEGLISVAQTAPQDIEVMKVAGTLQENMQPISLGIKYKESDADDEVQIIGVQTKNSSAKHEARYFPERKSNDHLLVSEPLCLKQNKKENDVDFPKNEPAFEDQRNNKSPFSHRCETIILDEEEQKPILNAKNLKQVNENSSLCEEETNLKVDYKTDSPCKNISIKQESLDDQEPISVKCAEREIEDKIILKNEPQSEKDFKCDLKRDISKKSDTFAIKLEEETVQDQEIVYNENHGLNLLWNTIEKVTSFERADDSEKTSAEISMEINQMNEPVDTYNSFKEMNSVRGLDLLSVIAGQRLVSEFDVCKSEADESSLKCNYPEIKEIKVLLEDDQAKHICEVSKNSSKSFVFEIQTRLVELRKKYKQKQKELSRLKPKRRFVSNSYLKGRQKSLKDISDRSSSNISSTESDNLNSSFSSVDIDEAEEKSEDINQISSDLKSKPEVKISVIDVKTKRRSRISTVKKENSNEMSSALSERRVTRRNVLKQNPSDKILELSEESKSIKRSSRSKTGKLKKTSDLVLNSSSDASQTPSSKSTINKSSLKKSSSLPENVKTTKVYSLRHTSQNVIKKSETAEITVLVSKTISSKRKSVNPKKYIPSKQSKLSETIIAKQLRSRILFDTSGSTSDDENLKDGVPDDLYVALMKCHLGEETKCGNKLLKDIDASKSSIARALGYPEPKRLNSEHLVERQRLLALEDGLFYAGFIKEYQSPKKYGIALDGQRGNRLHMFTREELLTQAIVESKPLTSELPAGTRVCAYWSQQYRCLYPGVVGKAPCPSADWSEPRVFVLFDDGDSGQIPAKNVRLIPEDIIPIENITRTDPINALTSCYNRQRTNSRGRSRKLKCSSPKSSNMKHSDTSNENESKESSCGSINESSCDDSCFIDYSLSPSHTPEDHNSMSCSLNSSSSIKLGKRQRKHSKRRTSRRIKLEQVDPSEIKDKCEAKTKRHKKYKDKHRKHHHHHHRHHHHHHHHHHSKKRKHKRKFARNTTPQDLENCIPCNSNLKSYKDIQSRAKACTDLIEHSSTVNLPQSEQNRVC